MASSGGRLHGSVAFITGAGRGIGRAAALALAQAGAAVTLCARSADELQAAAREVTENGGRAFMVTADVNDFQAMQAAAAAAEAELGPCDLLVCNAGIGPLRPAPMWQVDPVDWWRVLEVNVLGVLHTVRALVPAMVEQGRGRVIHLGSLAGTRPSRIASSYAVSKAALLRIADCLAADLEGTGVVSLAVSPGLVRTVMTAEMEKHVDIPESAWVPIDRSAELIVRLAAGDGDELTGLLIHALDDLDQMVARADEIRARGWYSLRLVRGLDSGEPA